jgi:hypothetical protein
MAKKGPFNMGEYSPDKLETQAYVWCIRNAIYIAPFAIQAGSWGITIKNKEVVNKDPKNYVKGGIWPKIFEYYKYYFNKYENKV